MTKEQQAIIDLLNGEGIPNSTDWQEIFKLSCQLGIAALVFDEIQKSYSVTKSFSFPIDLKLQWFATQCKVEQRNRRVNQVLCQVVGLLNENSIPNILLKGQGLAQLYENPLHRQPGDIDLYVGAENYSHAKELFAQQGWLNNSVVHEDIKHLCFCINGVSVELHYYAAIIPGIKHNRCFQKMMENALSTNENDENGFFVDGVKVRTLPIEINVIYTFVHLFKHFIEDGISLRQLMDWLLLLRKCNEIDSNKLQKQLEEIGHLKVWQIFGCVMVKYFGLSATEFPCYNARYGQKSEKIITIVFKDTQRKSYLNTHADGFVAKIRVLGSLCNNFNRIFSLFPSECCEYTIRLLINTTTKYLKKLTGPIH